MVYITITSNIDVYKILFYQSIGSSTITSVTHVNNDWSSQAYTYIVQVVLVDQYVYVMTGQ